MKTAPLMLICAMCFSAKSLSALPEPVPFRVAARMPDAAETLSPFDVKIEGWLGARLTANATNRLLHVEEEPILAGFRHKPGSHPWIGEHVGKWMHAATLAWANTGDARLRVKLDRVAGELIAAQEQDGYLGTYVPEKRFGLYAQADWDVWSHKYNLIGLLTYYQFTGNEPALAACRKIGDLLLNTFGPGKKSIISAGTHVGMAATSVLEPVVWLYRFTGDQRYLDFALEIVGAWEEPKGPKIMSALLREKQVNQTANGKAYEMLSNLVGLCELARATGDRKFLEPALQAWSDVTAKRLYITGGASQGEHFRGDYELPNQEGAHVAETCVTTTWIQLNLQLLRLTGEARFGDELERTLYNHLTAAQHPVGADWCYFTPLESKKAYRADINCCHSSGPRGLVLAPQQAYLKTRRNDIDLLVVNTFETSRASTQLGGQSLIVEQQSQFPERGTTVLQFRLERPARFGLQMRSPAWAERLRLELNGQPTSPIAEAGWVNLPVRDWKDGDRVLVKFELGCRLIAGEHGNAGRAALAWGPYVLAFDSDENPGLPPPASLALADASCQLKPGPRLALAAHVRSRRQANPFPGTFLAFADAGSGGGMYQVWLRAPGTEWPANESLLADGEESRSRAGNVEGSIIDGDFQTFVVTFNAQPASEDWFAVALPEPAVVGRVVFAHGKSFHDGGWFDTSGSPPRVQVQREKGGPWETVGTLTDYPRTTAKDSQSLQNGQAFTLRLSTPVKAVAVRVLGRPAGGDNSRQAFSSCAELQAYAP